MGGVVVWMVEAGCWLSDKSDESDESDESDRSDTSDGFGGVRRTAREYLTSAPEFRATGEPGYPNSPKIPLNPQYGPLGSLSVCCRNRAAPCWLKRNRIQLNPSTISIPSRY
jgi:hypothetical protein